MFGVDGWRVDVGAGRFSQFLCPNISADDALPQVLGVVVRPASGKISYWVDAALTWWRDIGVLAVSEQQRIEVWPHQGITESELEVLRGAGCEAFRSPNVELYWVCRRTANGRLWETTISVAAP